MWNLYRRGFVVDALKLGSNLLVRVKKTETI